LVARELGPGVIIFRSGDKLYIVDYSDARARMMLSGLAPAPGQTRETVGLGTDQATGSRLRDDEIARQALGSRLRDDEINRQALGSRLRDDEINRQALGSRLRDDEINRQALGSRLRDDEINRQALGSRLRDDEIARQALGSRLRDDGADTQRPQALTARARDLAALVDPGYAYFRMKQAFDTVWSPAETK
jgi:dephospho-CoA kinase